MSIYRVTYLLGVGRRLIVRSFGRQCSADTRLVGGRDIMARIGPVALINMHTSEQKFTRLISSGGSRSVKE